MGRGTSKASGGSAGGDNKELNKMIQDAKVGIGPDGKEVSYMLVSAIGDRTYQLRDLDSFPEKDRNRLRKIIYDSVMVEGSNAKNTLSAVKTLNEAGRGTNSKPISINISQLDGPGLTDLITIAAKNKVPMNSDLIRDSLRLLAYYNK